jgi:plasmid stability protein
MANVTLSIDDDLLKRGREYASTHGTSLNALIRKLLQQHTSPPSGAVDSLIDRLKRTKGHSGGRKIEREELQRY